MIYYVNSAATSGGTGTIASPFNTLSALSGLALTTDDKILLKNNSVFYETFPALTVTNGTNNTELEVTNYGVGEKPIICGCKVAKNNWVQHATNIWKVTLNDLTGHSGYSSTLGIGAIFSINRGISIYKQVNTMPTNEDEFYLDNDIVYIYCNQNPYSAYGDLFISVASLLINLTSNVIYNNLWALGSARHGLSKGSEDGQGERVVDNICIKNCRISWCGGGKSTNGEWEGNAVELFNEYVINFEMRNNVIENVMDCGFTIQGTVNFTAGSALIENNVFVNCGQGIEFSDFETYQSASINAKVRNNLFVRKDGYWEEKAQENTAYLINNLRSQGGEALMLFNNNTIIGYKRALMLMNGAPTSLVKISNDKCVVKYDKPFFINGVDYKYADLSEELVRNLSIFAGERNSFAEIIDYLNKSNFAILHNNIILR